jgi:hypothetical protein
MLFKVLFAALHEKERDEIKGDDDEDESFKK